MLLTHLLTKFYQSKICTQNEKSILNKAFPRCVQGTGTQNCYKFAIKKGAIRVNTNNLSLNFLSSNKMCIIKNNETAFYT